MPGSKSSKEGKSPAKAHHSRSRRSSGRRNSNAGTQQQQPSTAAGPPPASPLRRSGRLAATQGQKSSPNLDESSILGSTFDSTRHHGIASFNRVITQHGGKVKGRPVSKNGTDAETEEPSDDDLLNDSDTFTQSRHKKVMAKHAKKIAPIGGPGRESTGTEPSKTLDDSSEPLTKSQHKRIMAKHAGKLSPTRAGLRRQSTRSLESDSSEALTQSQMKRVMAKHAKIMSPAEMAASPSDTESDTDEASLSQSGLKRVVAKHFDLVSEDKIREAGARPARSAGAGAAASHHHEVEPGSPQPQGNSASARGAELSEFVKPPPKPPARRRLSMTSVDTENDDRSFTNSTPAKNAPKKRVFDANMTPIPPSPLSPSASAVIEVETLRSPVQPSSQKSVGKTINLLCDPFDKDDLNAAHKISLRSKTASKSQAVRTSAPSQKQLIPSGSSSESEDASSFVKPRQKKDGKVVGSTTASEAYSQVIYQAGKTNATVTGSVGSQQSRHPSTPDSDSESEENIPSSVKPSKKIDTTVGSKTVAEERSRATASRASATAPERFGSPSPQGVNTSGFSRKARQTASETYSQVIYQAGKTNATVTGSVGSQQSRHPSTPDSDSESEENIPSLVKPSKKIDTTVGSKTVAEERSRATASRASATAPERFGSPSPQGVNTSGFSRKARQTASETYSQVIYQAGKTNATVTGSVGSQQSRHPSTPDSDSESEENIPSSVKPSKKIDTTVGSKTVAEERSRATASRASATAPERFGSPSPQGVNTSGFSRKARQTASETYSQVIYQAGKTNATVTGSVGSQQSRHPSTPDSDSESEENIPSLVKPSKKIDTTVGSKTVAEERSRATASRASATAPERFGSPSPQGVNTSGFSRKARQTASEAFSQVLARVSNNNASVVEGCQRDMVEEIPDEEEEEVKGAAWGPQRQQGVRGQKRGAPAVATVAKMKRKRKETNFLSNADMISKEKIAGFLMAAGEDMSKVQLDKMHTVGNAMIQKFLDQLSASTVNPNGMFKYSELEEALRQQRWILSKPNVLALEFASAFTREQMHKMAGILIPKPGEDDTNFDEFIYTD